MQQISMWLVKHWSVHFDCNFLQYWDRYSSASAIFDRIIDFFSFLGTGIDKCRATNGFIWWFSKFDQAIQVLFDSILGIWIFFPNPWCHPIHTTANHISGTIFQPYTLIHAHTGKKIFLFSIRPDHSFIVLFKMKCRISLRYIAVFILIQQIFEILM